MNINLSRKRFFQGKKNRDKGSVTPDKLSDPKLSLDEAKSMLIGKAISDLYYSEDESCLVMVVDGLKVGIWDSEQYFTEFGFSVEGKGVVLKYKDGGK